MFLMRFWKVILPVILLLLCGTVVVSQGVKDDAGRQGAETKPMTRLAYRGPALPHVCMAVGQDGDYLMWRSSSPQIVKGRLQPRQRKDFTGLMRRAQGVPGSGAILVHKEARVLVAETPDGQKPKRRIWVSDTDGENPFPAPVEKIARWMQGFNPKGARETSGGREDVCPSGDLKPLQPGASPGM